MDIILEYEHIWECQLNTRKTHMEVQWNINGWKSIQSNSSGPLHILHSSRFLLLCLPQKDQAHDQRRDDDEWLPIKLCFLPILLYWLPFNTPMGWRGRRCDAWAQCYQGVPWGGAGDRRCCVACWTTVGQLRKSRKRETTNSPTCKHGYLGQCDGIRYQN